jgi:hypothetical protein
MRKPTPTDFALLKFVRHLLTDMVVPLHQEGTILEAMVRLVAHEEGLDIEHTAFLVCLALGNVTEENWEASVVPF